MSSPFSVEDAFTNLLAKLDGFQLDASNRLHKISTEIFALREELQLLRSVPIARSSPRSPGRMDVALNDGTLHSVPQEKLLTPIPHFSCKIMKGPSLPPVPEDSSCLDIKVEDSFEERPGSVATMSTRSAEEERYAISVTKASKAHFDLKGKQSVYSSRDTTLSERVIQQSEEGSIQSIPLADSHSNANAHVNDDPAACTSSGVDSSAMLAASNSYSNYVPHERSCVLNPDSMIRTFWDFLSGFALLYDSMMLPFQIAWEPKSEGIYKIGSWVTTVFWTMDMCVSFNTGFYNDDGDLVFSRRSIVGHYFKGTLVFDLFICLSDWFGLALTHFSSEDENSSSSGFALLRIVKLNRILRILGVLRVSKIWDRLEQVNTMLAGDSGQMVAQIGGLFVLLVWLNHVLACVWYVIGRAAPSDTGASWLDLVVGGDTDIRRSDIVYQYLTSYHWSITQLTPGGVSIQAINSFERLFNIAFLLFGLLFCTSLISRLSALMVQLQMANKERNNVLKRLRRYLRQNKVSAGLSQRVEKQITNRLSTKRPLAMVDVPALNQLSKALRGELKREIFAPCLFLQPLFKLWDVVDERSVRTFSEALDCKQYSADDELFAPNKSTRFSYIAVSGDLAYIKDQLKSMTNGNTMGMGKAPTLMRQVQTVRPTVQMSGKPDPSDHIKIEKNKWVSCVAFFTSWTTRGTLISPDHAEVICVDGKKYHEAVLSQHDRLSRLMKLYEKKYVEIFEAEPSMHLTDLEDPVDPAKVVLSLPTDIKLLIAVPIFQKLRWKDWFSLGRAEALQELHNEVAAGKGALVFKKDGSPVRVAVVIAVKVTAPTGALLVQVGDVKDNKLRAVCQLPGKKLDTVYTNEVPFQLAQKHLVELNKALNEKWQVRFDIKDHSGMVTIEEQPSPRYGLMTQYHRHTFIAEHEVPEILAGIQRPPSDKDPDLWYSPPHLIEEFFHTNMHTQSSYASSRLSGAVKRMSRPSMFRGSAVKSPHGRYVLPWLADHWPNHAIENTNANGNGSVYAWMWQKDFETLKTLNYQIFNSNT